MKISSLRNWLSAILALTAFIGIKAQNGLEKIVPNTPGNTSTIYKYTPNDGGIFYDTNGGNEWAIVNAGREDGDEDGACDSQLFNMKTGEMSKVEVAPGKYIRFKALSADGNIVVGRMVLGNIDSNKAATYNRTTKKLTVYPDRFDANGGRWRNGHLVGCTPDGHYAFGYYQGYVGDKVGDDDVPHDWWYRPLLVDVEKGEVIPIDDAVLPQGGKLEAYNLTSISDDGRYVRGQANWFIGDGSGGFIYDTVTKRCVSSMGDSFFTAHGETTAQVLARLKQKHPELVSISGLSAGTATRRTYRCTATYKDEQGNNKTSTAVYFREIKGDGDLPDREEDIVYYPDIEDGNVSMEYMDDTGTFYGMTDTGGPLRSFKILYDGKYWVSLNQLCKQRFGYDFFEVTGFERSGTIMGVSPDGHRLISFADPMGESFCIDFGMTAKEACSTLDFLGTYSLWPENGAQFETLKSIELTFERPIRIAGTGKNIHLLDSKGNEVATALSNESAIQFKSGSSNSVIITFRTRSLNDGENYTVVIDEGTFETEKSSDCKNKEIRVEYLGRRGPVHMTACAPEAGSSLMRLDNQSSYIIMSFDCKIRLTEQAEAYIERVDDGTRAATLAMVAGTDASTKHQILMYPGQTVNLYEGQQYRLVISEGSITDYVGGEKSLNEKIEVEYTGSYVRPVPTGAVIFEDHWDNIAESLVTWLRYEGDHNTPQYTPASWEFDADNQPWNFSIRESNENPDYCAASHSMYAPSGTSDDWMMTPQLSLPEEGKVILSFDAQSYLENANDILDIYVYEDSRVLSYLNNANMETIKANAKKIVSVKTTFGGTMEGLSNEWTHFTVDLSEYAGKEIYVAFVNQNTNQSAIFVDNVIIEREMLYSLALDYEDRVTNAESQKISGKMTITTDKKITDITMLLLDAERNEVARKEWNGITQSSLKGAVIPFAFDTDLPLVKGSENKYSIEVKINENVSAYNGNIINLMFKPTRRVVLEEMTGIDCPNCPLGIQTIGSLEKIYGDRFIPVSLHTYNGDPYESGMTEYCVNFLGLVAAPSARINRINGVFYPMVSGNTEAGTVYYDSYPGQDLWKDAVAEEMDKMPLCDFEIKAQYTGEDQKEVTYTADVNYAINADNQQLALLFLVLEDNLMNYQVNAFGTFTSPVLGEWAKGGIYSGENSNGYVYPYNHMDVARQIVGGTAAGQIGLLPTAFTAGEHVTASYTYKFPTNVYEKGNAHVVGMLINSQTGEIINGAKCQFTPYDAAGISTLTTDALTTGTVYNLQGTAVMRNASASDIKALPTGIYLIGGKKVLVK